MDAKQTQDLRKSLARSVRAAAWKYFQQESCSPRSWRGDFFSKLFNSVTFGSSDLSPEHAARIDSSGAMASAEKTTESSRCSDKGSEGLEHIS